MNLSITNIILQQKRKSFQFSHLKSRLWYQRMFSSQPKTEVSVNNRTIEKPEQWKPIYKFSYIKVIAGVNKLKVYQAGFTAIGVPFSMGLEMSSVLPPGSTEIFAALGKYTSKIQ